MFVVEGFETINIRHQEAKIAALQFQRRGKLTDPLIKSLAVGDVSEAIGQGILADDTQIVFERADIAGGRGDFSLQLRIQLRHLVRFSEH